jgi:putative ABC transport system permease protein
MGQILDSIVVALQAIWANKLRSFMTVLGNIVAVTSIVTVVTLIQGMDALVSDVVVSEVGADTFSVQRTPLVLSEDDQERNRNNPLITLEEAERVRSFSPFVASVVAEASRSATVSYRTAEFDNVQVRGVTSEYLNLSNVVVARGRLMSRVEMERGQRVAFIGWDLADQAFGEVNPLEKPIKIAGVGFRVVGVSEAQGSFFGNSQDNFAVIPLAAYRRLFGARQNLQLTVKPTSTDDMQAAMDATTVALRVARRLEPDEPDNFGLFTSEMILDLYRQITAGIFAVLVGIVALSLVVGGIVIMNIMLMVVSERTREIGLRKALGARRKDIMSQVLTESITLSTLGGLVGIALGFLVANAISALTPLPARLEPWSIALGIGITAGVGLFFGAYPASRAASLDPIEALRRE